MAEIPMDMPWHYHGDMPPRRPEVKAPPTRARGDRPPWLAQYDSEHAMAQNHENLVQSTAEGRITVILGAVDKILQRIEGKIDADSVEINSMVYKLDSMIDKVDKVDSMINKIDKVDSMIDVIRTQLAARRETCCSCWMCLRLF